MNRSLQVFVVAIAAAAPLRVHAEGNSTSRITVQVSTLRSQRGTVACRLYAQGKGFPSEPTHLKEDKLPARGTSVRCEFADLLPGTYAVAVLHDEDDDGALDTNFIGVPQEGVGVSRNAKPLMRAPRWDEAKFELSAGAHSVLQVRLNY